MTTTLATPILTQQAVADSDDGLRGRDIVCFSHDWAGDPLSKTHLMRLLARHNRVLWVNSIGYRMPSANRADLGRIWKKLAAARQPVREVEPNIFVLNPLAIPAYGSSVARRLNQWWLRVQIRGAMRRLDFRRPINWTFNPVAAVVAGMLGEEHLIYQCVDEYSALAGVTPRAIRDLEARLLKEADLVIVSAQRLLQSKRCINPHTVMVRHGVDFELFRRALEPQTIVPAEIARLPRPVLGFFGLLSEDWIDLELLVKLAQRYASGSLVLLGLVRMDLSRLALPNVHVLGRQPYESLPAWCKGFDVGLIPFVQSELTLNANPLKAREYLAAGLPVVSTDLPEVAVLPVCRIGRSHEGFLEQVEAALQQSGPRPERSEQMRSESWQARLEEIEAHWRCRQGNAARRSRSP